MACASSCLTGLLPGVRPQDPFCWECFSSGKCFLVARITYVPSCRAGQLRKAQMRKQTKTPGSFVFQTPLPLLSSGQGISPGCVQCLAAHSSCLLGLFVSVPWLTVELPAVEKLRTEVQPGLSTATSAASVLLWYVITAHGLPAALCMWPLFVLLPASGSAPLGVVGVGVDSEGWAWDLGYDWSTGCAWVVRKGVVRGIRGCVWCVRWKGSVWVCLGVWCVLCVVWGCP